MVGCVYVFSGQLPAKALKLLESLQIPENHRSGNTAVSHGVAPSPQSQKPVSHPWLPLLPLGLHPRHIQTLSKSCQFNLLNISGIRTLLSILAASSLGQALFISPCTTAATVSFLVLLPLFSSYPCCQVELFEQHTIGTHFFIG